MTTEHQQLRESLGSYPLGRLHYRRPPRSGRYLDRCRPCRIELAEVAPVVALVRTLDPDCFGVIRIPPTDLRERTSERTRAEHPRAHEGRRDSAPAAAAADSAPAPELDARVDQPR